MIATLRRVRRRHDAAAAGGACWRGDRSPAARCSSPCSCRSCCGVAPDLRLALDTASDRRAHRRPQFRAGVRQPRRRAGQRVHRHAARQPAADRRGRPACRTRSCSTRCRSACSACRSRRRSCRRCRASPAPMPRGAEARAPAARRRAAADRVLRRAVGDGVSRARRRRRRGAAADRPLRPRRRGVRLGDPRRLGGRPAGVDARAGCTRRPTTRCATRARRCATRRPRRADDGARVSRARSAAAARSASRRGGAPPG